MTPSPTSRSSRPGLDDVTPLVERLALVQGFRLAIVAAVIGVRALTTGSMLLPMSTLVAACAAYLAVVAAGELTTRLAPLSLIRRTAGALLLIDGVFLAYVGAYSGGPSSPYTFLVYLHLITVSLLISYRTGVKIALWHTILLVVSYSLFASGYLETDIKGFDRQWWLHTVALWAISFVTAAFSGVNERELRRSKGDLRAFADMGTELEEIRDPDVVMQVVVDAVMETFPFKRAALVAPSNDRRWSVAVPGVSAPLAIELAESADVDEIVAFAWDRRRPFLVSDVETAENPLLRQVMPGASNLVLVPLVADGEPLGALVGEWGGRVARVNRRTIDMVAQFCAHGALAFRNALLLAEVQQQATRDGLTGLANRRAFDRHLEEVVKHATIERQPVSLVMLDIDHFKSINDTHGHQVGDEVLRKVATAILGACRSVDFAARYGGEEFVVVLPACDAQEAMVTAERFREAVANAPLPVPLTISAGIASFPAHADTGTDTIAAADSALYSAKRNGRNQSVLFELSNAVRRRRTDPADFGASSPQA